MTRPFHPVHPAIQPLLDAYCPADPAAIFSEGPHECVDSPKHGNIAYWKGERAIFCKLGRYIKRHFPQLLDHNIAAIVERYNASLIEASYRIVADEEMINVMLQIGDDGEQARSCMTRGKIAYGWDEMSHPYRVYSSRLGWGLFVRERGGLVTGRALVNSGHYVKLYSTCPAGQYSEQYDAGMTEALENNGYSKMNSWMGYSIEMIEHGKDYLAPYVDGDVSGWDSEGEICRNGVYQGNVQGITPQNNHSGEVETMSGDWIDEDDAVYVDYRWRGQRYEGYVGHDEAEYVESRDDYYLSEHVIYWNDRSYYISDCTQLSNGDWAPEYECTETRDGDTELKGDCILDYNGDYILAEDARELHDGEDAHRDECAEFEGKYYLKEECVVDLNADYIPMNLAVSMGSGWTLATNCEYDDRTGRNVMVRNLPWCLKRREVA